MMGKKTVAGLAYIEVIAAGILWGCMGLFVRNLNTLGLATMGIVAIRCFITCILVLLYLAIFKRELLKIKLKDIWCFLGTGFCSVLFFNFCYFKSMTLTSLSIAAILLYTSPAFIMVMSFFLFKEKFNRFKVAALVMTFVGCIFVSGLMNTLVNGGNLTLSPAALLLGLGAGFGYALYSIFGRYALERGYHSLTITFYTFLFASVGSLFFTDLPQLASVFTGSIKGCLLCVGIAVFGTLIPYITYTAGLNGMDNGRASVVVSIEPAVATVVSFFVYHENPGIWGLIGIVLVLGAVVLVNMSAAGKRKK
ncbi:MAG: DMT family transporter [Lachnospiraceae bacterium]|nr:DMT family transporter [Lachnospiraceae bacterium]